MRPLFVGEDNPYSDDPGMALFPAPRGCAGHRLCAHVLGLGVDAYLRNYDRVNLCAGSWSAAEAAEMATLILADLDARLDKTGPKPVVVLLGAKVARAFGVPFEPFTEIDLGPARGVVLPHPSGRSRAWNEPGSAERARAVLRAVGAL